MNKRLKDNITSEYLEAANSLKSKKAKRKIVAYVESYDDVLFWRTLLGQYEDDTRYFEIMLPSHDRLGRGKRSVIMSCLCGNVGRDMIACVDADYDYLIQGATETSKEIIQNPYIFHTYAYAIENLQCYAPSLHNVCVMVTLNDRHLFDFENFMQKYSEAVFPLFVWSIWHYRNGRYMHFTINEFNRYTDIGKVDIDDPDKTISNLRSKISKVVNRLIAKNPYAKSSYLRIKTDLLNLGVTPQTTYLYMQGHHLFNRVILPLMDKVCSLLITDRENEIRRLAVHDTQMRNELSCYTHSIQDITQMLKKNTGYVSAEPFIRMRADMEHFLGVASAAGQQAHT